MIKEASAYVGARYKSWLVVSGLTFAVTKFNLLSLLLSAF